MTACPLFYCLTLTAHGFIIAILTAVFNALIINTRGGFSWLTKAFKRILQHYNITAYNHNRVKRLYLSLCGVFVVGLSVYPFDTFRAF